jgi:transposase
VLNRHLDALTTATAPATSAIFGLGTDTAAALLAAIGDNADRLRSEAAFVHFCGVSPIPASSGNTNGPHLHRDGDWSGNRALHIAVVVGSRHDQRARQYATGRTRQGMSRIKSFASRSATFLHLAAHVGDIGILAQHPVRAVANLRTISSGLSRFLVAIVIEPSCPQRGRRDSH